MAGQNILGDCHRPRDSAMPWTQCTVTLNISGLVKKTIHGGIPDPDFDTYAPSCSFTQTISRIDYDPASDPSIGQFYLIQDCCCPFRWKAIFGRDGFGEMFSPVPQVTITTTIHGGGGTSTSTTDIFLEIAALMYLDTAPGFGYGLYAFDTPEAMTPCKLDAASVIQPPSSVSVYDVIQNFVWVWSNGPTTGGSATGTYAFSGMGVTQTGPVWPVMGFSDGASGSEYEGTLVIDPTNTTHSYTGTMTLSGSDSGGETSVTVIIGVAFS